MKQYEEQVADLAYPATLAPALKRLIATKLVVIQRQWNDARNRLVRPGLSPYRQVALAELPADVRAQVERVMALRAEVKTLEAALAPMKVWDGDVTTDRTQEEMRAEQRAMDRAFKEIDAERDRAIDGLKTLIAEIAASQLTKVRAKIPATLVARLDAIGTRPALPAGTVTYLDVTVIGSICDECGAAIPDPPAGVSGGLANRHHAPSCSLHDAEGV